VAQRKLYALVGGECKVRELKTDKAPLTWGWTAENAVLDGTGVWDNIAFWVWQYTIAGTSSSDTTRDTRDKQLTTGHYQEQRSRWAWTRATQRT
jgi:hypothetical protein